MCASINIKSNYTKVVVPHQYEDLIYNNLKTIFLLSNATGIEQAHIKEETHKSAGRDI